MEVTVSDIFKITGGRGKAANIASVIDGMAALGSQIELHRPEIFAQYIAQLMTESGNFIYDREIWGPTAAQLRYDVRTDLGNTPARDGDGHAYRGRGPIQITGHHNYREFTNWIKAALPGKHPNFVEDPDAVVTDPYEGIGPIWYWKTRKLTYYASRGDIEMVTRRINGGLNGFDHRVASYMKAGIWLLNSAGVKVDDVASFQRSRGLIADGIPGPKTRLAMHQALEGLSLVLTYRRHSGLGAGSGPTSIRRSFSEIIAEIFRKLFKGFGA